MISFDAWNFGFVLLCLPCYYLLTFLISKSVTYSSLILQMLLTAVPQRLSPQYMFVELKAIVRISPTWIAYFCSHCCFLVFVGSCFRELWQ